MDDNKCRSWQQSEEQNGNNSVEIATNPSATENVECISNIGETSHFSHTDSSTIPVIPVNDPSTWRLSTKIQKEAIIRECTPENPQCFPRDSSGRCFDSKSIFFQDLPNGEKVKRDWLVWSSPAQGLFYFACCLFQALPREDRASQSSQLARCDAGVKDNWRKLYEKTEAHQRNSHHITCYLTWKDLEKNLNELVGIDSSLRKQFATEMAKWREIFRWILDESFSISWLHYQVIQLDDPNKIMDFSLGIWSYLVVIIKCLKCILMRF